MYASFESNKMSENFELSEFHGPNDKNVLNSSEENLQTPNTFLSDVINKKCQNLRTEDFFIKYDVSEAKAKNKKAKRKRKTPKDLMNVVNSELTLMEIPVQKNVLNILNDVKINQKHIIKNSSSGFSPAISSRGYRNRFHKHKTSSINPIYPRIFEDLSGDSIVTGYVPPNRITHSNSKNEINEKQNVRFLDIELNNMKIIHHHNFSVEKLLIRKFLDIYKNYKNIQSKLNECHKDIKIYRETKNNLKEKLLKVDPKKENVLFDPIFRNYVKKLLESKEILLDLIKKYKEIVNKIISLWSDILMVREKTGLITTLYNIDIRKTVLDNDEYERKWQETYNQEIMDITDKLEYDFVTKYLEYKQNKYKSGKIRNLSKPKLVIDDEVIKDDVKKLLEVLVMREEIEVELTINEKRKIKNKSSLFATVYTFQIFVDGNFVCESDHYNNDGNYDIDLFESYSIQILPHNEDLVIILCENNEKCLNQTIKLSEIRANVHKENKELIFQSNLRIEPSSTNIGSGFSIKEIASALGVRLKSSNLFKGQVFTKYIINMNFGWSGNFDENHRSKLKKYIETSKKINKLLDIHDKPSFDMLKEVIENIYELNTSENSSVTDKLKNLCSFKIKPGGEGFVIDNNSNDVIRLKLLSLRNSGKYSELNDKIIPLLSNELSTEQLHCLQNSDDKDLENVCVDSIKQTNLNPIEKQRYIAFKYITDLNKSVMQNLKDSLLKKTYRDVVCNFKDLSLRSMLGKDSNISTFESVNGLRQFLDPSQVREQELIVTIYRAFNLPDRMKSILSEDSLNEKDSDHIAGIKMKSLRPFVRVAFKENCEQTSSAVGCYPAWNQTLRININDVSSGVIHINLYDEVKENVSEDYIDEDTSLHSRTVHYRYCNKWLGGLDIPLNKVLSLDKLQGTFKLRTPSIILGYENTADCKSAFQSLTPEVSRIMKKDCAFVSLQISVNPSVRVNRYKHLTMTSNDDDYIIKYLNEFITNYTKEFPSRNIALTFIDSGGQNKCVTQFLQPIIPPDYACFSKNIKRIESALSKTSGFSKSSSSSQVKTERDEQIKDLDIERAEIATPSYSHVNDFWTTEIEPERLISCCARYVSLIPIYNAEHYTVTLMGSELLQVLHGSPLDHTLLLSSYFLYLGIKCWVIVGLNSKGVDSYVLVKYNVKLNKALLQNDYTNDESRNKWFSNSQVYSWFIIDATTAEQYDIRDFGCPLKTVSYVFNNENIWVNMQSTSVCESVSFNFSKSSEWQVVFDKSIFVASLPIISDRSIYVPVTDVESLREKLENKIKAKVQKWRTRTKTVWNRYCSTLLRELIPQWESWAVNPDESKPSLGQKLKQLMITYKVYGFPLNMPFVNIKSVLSAIKSTALHMNDDTSLEFGLAVEMYPYPNNVISVWVFFVSITRI